MGRKRKDPAVPTSRGPLIQFRLHPELAKAVTAIGDMFGDQTPSRTCQRIAAAAVAMFVADRDMVALRELAAQWPRLYTLLASVPRPSSGPREAKP